MILEGLSDPLVHLLRNAVAHGIEPPSERERLGKPTTRPVELRAEQRGGLIEIDVSDDGRGVLASGARRGRADGFACRRPGTAGVLDGERRDASSPGEASGLDAVKSHVEAFGGSLEVRSEPGRGTDVVPAAPAGARAARGAARRARRPGVYGLPLASVEEVIAVTDTLSLGGHAGDRGARQVAAARATSRELLGGDGAPLCGSAPAVVVSAGGSRLAITCDALIGKDEVVVKTPRAPARLA